MQNWIETENGLFRELKFKNNKNLLDFFEKLKVISDEMDHHADYKSPIDKTLEIYLLTHYLNKVTQKDYDLAQKIDVLFASY